MCVVWQVGAELGVGMCEDIRQGANWKLFFKIFVSWVFTLIVTALLSAAFFAQGGWGGEYNL
jgi:sodium-dependent phosphate transporter